MAEWTDDDLDTAKTMWRAGSSAGVIAEHLGNGLSRNAVLGKLHRLGIGRDANAAAVPPPRIAKSASPIVRSPPRAAVPPPVKALTIVPALARLIAPPPDGGIEMDALRNNTCRWPLWDEAPSYEESRYCGAADADLQCGRPYCSAHAARAFNATKPRAPRTPARASGRGHSVLAG